MSPEASPHPEQAPGLLMAEAACGLIAGMTAAGLGLAGVAFGGSRPWAFVVALGLVLLALAIRTTAYIQRWPSLSRNEQRRAWNLGFWSGGVVVAVAVAWLSGEAGAFPWTGAKQWPYPRGATPDESPVEHGDGSQASTSGDDAV